MKTSDGSSTIEHPSKALGLKCSYLFLSSNQVHQYETRLASQYRPHFCRTNIKQFNILYRGPKIWNSLPCSLISSPSISVFFF